MGMIMKWLATVVIGMAVLAPVTPAPADDVPTYLRRHAATHHIPGLAAAVVRDGRVVSTVTLGEDGNGATVTPQTPFLLGSVSKAFTALAVMQLVEAGRVELDAPVRRYLPWFRLRDEAAARAITVRQLLTHTSGLPQTATMGLTDRFDNTAGGLDRSVRDLATIDGTGRPGARHEYSDANYVVLGALVAAVSGQPFGGYLRRHVLDPLDMRHSATTAAEASAAGLPPGHRMWFGRPRRFDSPFDTSGVPYGYLAASLEDVTHFVMAQLGGGSYGAARILSERGIAETHTGRADTGGGGRYGFGWRETRNGLVWHAGATPGYFSHIVLEPATRTGVVVLSNVYSPALDPALASAAFDVAAIVRGDEPDPADADPVFTYVLVALVVIGVALAAGIGRVLIRRRTGSVVSAVVWVLGCGSAAAAVVVGVPAAWGAGIREALLFTPDIGWTLVTVAALTAVLGLARAGVIVVRRPGTVPAPATPDGRTTTPAPDHTRSAAAPPPVAGSPHPPR
jgi:CubicO group peptidase (beta-lactamase class C family)